MSIENVTAEKAALRERFRLARAARTDTRTRSALICAALEDVLEDAGTVHLFWPLPGEVDLRPLAEHLLWAGTTVVLPAVAGPRRLEHRPFEGAHALVPGRWGLLEPHASARSVAPADLEVVVVPGLAFGRDGTRLGMGGGFYDAFLPQTQALRVGVAFEDALLASVPTEPHDVGVEVVVTERETVRVL